MTRSLLLAVMVGAVAMTGCSHAMRITNLEQYRSTPTPPLEPQKSLGVVASGPHDPLTAQYVRAIANALREDGSFERVLYPYGGQPAVDAVVEVKIAPRYSGKPSNFFVNWPGFLIFAPAIWGYGYEAAIDTSVVIRTSDGATGRLAIPTVFQFRQAELDRTWTEIGWLEVGIIPLLGGMAFTQYDTDLTPEFVAKVGPHYGEYVAQKVKEAVANLGPAPVAEPEVGVVPGS